MVNMFTFILHAQICLVNQNAKLAVKSLINMEYEFFVGRLLYEITHNKW